MRRVAYILGGLVLVAAGVIAVGWYELRANGKRVREHFVASLAKVRDEFLEDQELARTYPVLAPARREHDAGPFLNARIGWDIDATRLARWRERFPAPVHSLAIDRAVVDRIPADWAKSPASLWQELDFSWMADLRSFDHWDVEADSPWADEPQGSWPNGFPLLPTLVPWAKLRVAKGLSTGTFATAAAETEQLGVLLLSTETMLGMATGLQVLELVREGARAEGVARETEAHFGIDERTRAQAFRATMAAQSFFRGEVPETYRRDAYRISVGRCAALNEALRGALALRAAAVPDDGEPIHWIRIDGEFASACRLTLVRRAIVHGRHGNAEPRGSCDSADSTARLLCRVIAAIPGLRAAERAVRSEILVQMMLANSHPDTWYRMESGAR